MRRQAQRGITLLELMIGIAIGLLVVAVAMAALMVSRGVSGTVSDASGIQQQAAYGMRLIGLQLRQGGSLYLNPGPAKAASAALDAADPVAFETKVTGPTSGNSFDPATDTLSGTANTLTVAYRRYEDPVFTSTATQSPSRNCVNGPADGSGLVRVESAFFLNGTDLMCDGDGVGTGAPSQPVLQNVANFQVRYLLQDVTTTPGNPQLRYLDAAAVGSTDWPRIQGVEVCLVLYGAEAIDLPSGSTYTDCDGITKVDMSALTGPRAKRMHLAFRNVFQVRSQGLVGSAM